MRIPKKLIFNKIIVGNLLILVFLSIFSYIYSSIQTNADTVMFSSPRPSMSSTPQSTGSPAVCTALNEELKKRWEEDLKIIQENQGFVIPNTPIELAFDNAVAAARSQTTPTKAMSAAFRELTPIQSRIKANDEHAIKQVATEAAIQSLAYKLPFSLPTNGQAASTVTKPTGKIFEGKRTFSSRDGIGYEFKLIINKDSSKLDVNGKVSCDTKGNIDGRVNATYKITGQIYLNGSLKASSSRGFTSYFFATKEF